MRRLLPIWLTCCAVAIGCSAGANPTTGPSVTGPRLARTRFLAFGDSLTLGEVTTPVSGILPLPSAGQPHIAGPMVVVPAAAYPTQLLSLLNARYVAQRPVTTVINAGKGGEHAHEGAARFSATFSATLPEVVLLWEGVNSLILYGTDLPLLALTEMTTEAQARGARVFVANMPPTRPGFRNSQSILRLQEMNEKVKAMAAAQGAVLVNMYDALLPDVDAVIGNDGLHPTEAGYRRIADVFYAAIRAELEVP
jgi:lysophospholipase L1-like esterase